MERNKCHFDPQTSQWPNPITSGIGSCSWAIILAFCSTWSATSPFPTALKGIPRRPESFLNMWVQRVIWERTSLPESALATQRCGPVTFSQQEAAQSWEGKESGPRRKVINVQELQFSFRKWAEGGARMRRGCKAWFQVNSKQDGALHLLTRAGYCQEVKLPLLLQKKTHSEDWGQWLAPRPNLCLAGQGRNTRWSLDTQNSMHFMGRDCAEGVFHLNRQGRAGSLFGHLYKPIL